MTADDPLLAGGPSNDQHDCGELDLENVSIEEFASCPRGFVAATIDSKTMAETTIASGPANPDFSNVTMALQVSDVICAADPPQLALPCG